LSKCEERKKNRKRREQRGGGLRQENGVQYREREMAEVGGGEGA
jgi:hypothetical protein